MERRAATGWEGPHQSQSTKEAFTGSGQVTGINELHWIIVFSRDTRPGPRLRAIERRIVVGIGTFRQSK